MDNNALKEKTLFLLDMDGTLYNGNILFDGVLEFLDTLKKQNKHYMYITNNSSRSVKDYVKKLKKLGIKATKEEFYTSSMATAKYIKEHYSKDTLIYVQGTRSLVKELKKNKIKVTTKYDENAKVVLTGFDTELTFKKLKNTVRLLDKGLDYIATNPDYVCPSNKGNLIDNGSIQECLYNATGRKAINIGKPLPTMIYQCLELFKLLPKDCLVIGDRLYTDIQSAVNAGVDSLCVLSGESSLEDIENYPSKPTYILSDIKELLEIIR